MTILTMTFLGLETRNDLPKVTYMTALDYFVAITFAFIFATIVQFAIVHFYTKVGSGEYYIPPIEILEDIKAFHRARQREQQRNEDNSEEEDEDSPVEIIREQEREERDEDDYSGSQLHELPCDVIVGENCNNSGGGEIISTIPRSRLTNNRMDEGGEIFHLTSQQQHLRQYSSSAPPMSINVGATVLPIEGTMKTTGHFLAASGYSPRSTSESRTGDHFDLGCMADVLGLERERRRRSRGEEGGRRRMKQDCISTGEEEADDEYRTFCPIHVRPCDTHLTGKAKRANSYV